MIFGEYDAIEAAKTRIKVIGVGGAGNNAIDHMIENKVGGVEFYAVNTDAQDLKNSKASNRLLIGKTKTHGQGAGSKPEVGRAAALEGEDDIHEMIGEAEMVFITCGMGGGTGTGAAPIIARIAREHGCLTVGICTKPFSWEGPQRMQNAMAGIEEIKPYVDSLIIIPNDKLKKYAGTTTRMLDAFREADNILRKGVQGISEIISLPGLINVDFADVKTVMQNKGTALMGIGAATGENRALEAARKAINSPLLEVKIDGATAAIVNITASQDVTLSEIDTAVSEIRNNSGKDLNIIYGAAINNDLGDEIVVTVVATGYELKQQTSGFDDLADAIYDNLLDEDDSFANLNVNIDEDDFEEEEIPTQESRTAEIFATSINKREEKKRQKEEESRRRLFERQQKKEEKSRKSSGEEPKKKAVPSWLSRG